MKNFKVLALSAVMSIFAVNCAHVDDKKETFGKNEQNQLYNLLEKEIRSSKAKELKECNCMKALYRNLFNPPDRTARYFFDEQVGEHGVALAQNRDTVRVLAIGSGTLLNELTAVSNILARGKNLDLYITDWAYVFYGEDNFKEKAINLGKNKDLIPEGWKEFYFWNWYEDKKEPYIPFFEKHHKAIEKFKTIMSNLDKHYGTKTKIRIIKPPAEKAIQLPKLDMIISIDSFLDVPNLMWNLFYQLKLNNMPVRFLALNKAKPLGGFWDSPDLSVREKNSLKPVSIDIYDIESNKKHGSYTLIDQIIFNYNKSQLEYAPEFEKNPKRDSTQSPLDKSVKSP